jgi:hypothetical protein
MALSNWDTLAFDTDGQSCLGRFEHHVSKNYLQIYKNWVYAANNKMWMESSGFKNPIIASINSGSMEIAGFNVEAKRGPQSSVFVYAHYRDYDDKQADEKAKFYQFGGIGAYGFKDIVLEVLKKHNREIKDDEVWYDGCDWKGRHLISCPSTGEEIVYWDEKTQGKYDYSKDWIGVLPSTVEEFFNWLSSILDDDISKQWLEKIKKSDVLRYNQGDLFFAENASVPLNATKPGQSAAPVFLDKIAK